MELDGLRRRRLSEIEGANGGGGCVSRKIGENFRLGRTKLVVVVEALVELPSTDLRSSGISR